MSILPYNRVFRRTISHSDTPFLYSGVQLNIPQNNRIFHRKIPHLAEKSLIAEKNCVLRRKTE